MKDQMICKTMAERETGDFIKFDTIACTFNPEALKIVKSQLFRQWAFVEKLNAPILKDSQPEDKKKKKTQTNTIIILWLKRNSTSARKPFINWIMQSADAIFVIFQNIISLCSQ